MLLIVIFCPQFISHLLDTLKQLLTWCNEMNVIILVSVLVCHHDMPCFTLKTTLVVH